MPGSRKLLTTLTRDADANRIWARKLKTLGFPTHNLPCIEFRPLELSAQDNMVLDKLPSADWLLFTSVQGVNYFMRIAQARTLDRRMLAKLKIAVVGRATADAVTARGLLVAFVPSKPDADTLARQLKGVKGRRVIIVSSNLSDPALGDILKTRGAHIDTLTLYETIAVTQPDPAYEEQLASRRIGAVIFASPSAARAYDNRLTPDAKRLARDLPAIAIGPTTAQEVAGLGFTKVKQAASPSVDELVKLLNY